jgi:hypothetical protein
LRALSRVLFVSQEVISRRNNLRNAAEFPVIGVWRSGLMALDVLH